MTETGAGLLPGAAIGGSFGAMLLIGAMTSCYGPLIPYLETRYGISRATAGAVLGADFGGSLAGVLWAIWAVRRLPNRGYLMIALAAVAAGSALLATAAGWWQVLAGAAVAGGGFGILDFSLNRLFTPALSPAAARAPQLLCAKRAGKPAIFAHNDECRVRKPSETGRVQYPKCAGLSARAWPGVAGSGATGGAAGVTGADQAQARRGATKARAGGGRIIGGRGDVEGSWTAPTHR